MASRHSADRVIEEIAGRQRGLVTRAQLLQAGVAPDVVRWRVRTKRLQPVHRGVYLVGPLVVPRMRELAAVLACGSGARLSHWSAGILWEVRSDRDADFPVDVTVCRGEGGRRPGIRVHRTRELQPDEVTELEGIPVTTLARTVFDLASESSSSELSPVVAAAENGSATVRAELSVLIARYPKRRGVPMLRDLLANDEPPAMTRSEAEMQLLRLIRRAQLPRPEVNVWIERYEVDFLWRKERIVVEVDGFAFHSSRGMFENDRRRDATLMASGFRVMRVTWHQITTEPEALLVRLALALTASGANGN